MKRVFLGALALPLAYSLYEPHRLVVRRFDVALENLPREADGLRLVQISDLHCSAFTSARFLARAVALCNAENPDLVAITGDFVSRRNSYLPFTFARLWARPEMEYAHQVAEVLSRLHAPEGVFAVPGNHDRAGEKFDAIADLLRQSGVTPLVNENVRVRNLPIIGVDDLREGRPDVRAACAGTAPDETQVILSHNPRMLALIEQRNALVLAGHTHFGQVHLPLTQFHRTPRDTEGSVWQGGWFRAGRAQMYVSAGVGSVHFPMRFACPPEIVIFTLKRK